MNTVDRDILAAGLSKNVQLDAQDAARKALAAFAASCELGWLLEVGHTEGAITMYREIRSLITSHGADVAGLILMKRRIGQGIPE